MESIIRKLRIQTLKGQAALCRFKCAALASEFEIASLSVQRKGEVHHVWEESIKECHVLQLMIDLLERQVREEQIESNRVC